MIFELFDSLILLGVGGHVVYHGKVKKVTKYFLRLDYELPPGESIADWLIDISSGRLEQAVFDEDDSVDESDGRIKSSSKETRKKTRKLRMAQCGFETSDDEEEYGIGTDDDEPSKIIKSENEEDNDPELLLSAGDKEKGRREYLYKCWRKHFEKLSKKKRSLYKAPKPFDLPTKQKRPAFMKQLGYQLHRLVILGQRNW